MTAEIICVGTELLLGNIINTNGAYLANQCAKYGIACYYQDVVGDNEERLLGLLKTATQRADVILLSGGLGPTEDDMTKESVAKFLGKELVLDQESLERIEEYFKTRKLVMTENNKKQALIPEGAVALPNDNGTAPGIYLETEGATYVLLPGPPQELIPMVESQVMPRLLAKSDQAICSQTVKICGIGESKAETMIKDLIDAQTNPTIATYAKVGEVHIRVTAKAEDEKEALKLIKPVIKELKNRFGNAIYTTDESITLEKAVADLLLANHLTISCAESCTGGKLSARLIGVPGISEAYKVGYVTYSNKSKRKLLDVKKSILQKYGAVSENVAKEMVKGLMRETETDVTLATTGIAGPDGGTPEKPVGLVYIACNVKGKIVVKECHFKGDREKIRDNAVAAALELARLCLLEYFSEVTFGKEKK